jgi:hypothetical protein
MAKHTSKVQSMPSAAEAPPARAAEGLRPVLVASLDLGVSFGLRDTTFAEDQLADAEIGIVGLDPPIGRGVVVDVLRDHAELLDAWREEACRQARRKEMELGPRKREPAFIDELIAVVQRHPVDRCTLTVYAIGSVYVEVWFGASMPDGFLRGLTKCFEYAAYRPAIGGGLHSAALRQAEQCLRDPSLVSSPLTELTRRDLPALVEDRGELDAEGRPYTEQLFIPSFSALLVCTDPRDDAKLPGRMTELDPTVAFDTRPIIDFEYHGRIRFGWATTAVEARAAVSPDDPGTDDPDDQIRRMLTCIQIAQVHLGTCVAFEGLFRGEIDEQVGGYLRKTRGGRDPEDLNRLRNLALAVVSLTESSVVTETEEDRKYFAAFEQVANTDKKRQFISTAADMVYSVADAETQRVNARRQNLFSAIVLLLTSLTLLSVSADVYDFVRAEQSLVEDRNDRVRLLAEFVLALCLLVTVLWYLVIAPGRHRRSN